MINQRCKNSGSSSISVYARAWKICDASNGGVIDSSEFKKCLNKLGLTKCGQTALKSKGTYYGNKRKFYTAYAYALFNNKCTSGPVSATSAWKICDASRGGVIDSGEFRKCLNKIGLSTCG